MTGVSEVSRTDADHVEVHFKDGTGSSVKMLTDEEAVELLTELGAALHAGETDE